MSLGDLDQERQNTFAQHQLVPPTLTNVAAENGGGGNNNNLGAAATVTTTTTTHTNNVDPFEKLPSDSDMETEQPPQNRVRIYPHGHKGPFFVYIRAAKDQTLRHVQISKFLFGKFNKLEIGKITQMNNHKMRVEFLTAAAANSLVRGTDPQLSPYRVYIPAEGVEVEGIIRLDAEEELNDLRALGRGQFGHPNVPEVEIIDAYRFEKLQHDESGKVSGKTATPLVRVTFPGTLLPHKVVLDGLLIPVEPYKRKAMFCENCLRAGHTEKYCVVKPKCAKCGSEHKSKDCQMKDGLTKCYVCGSNHDPTDRSKCPTLAQANLRQQRKTKKKISKSYADAVKTFTQANNYYDSLSSASDDEQEVDETATEAQSTPFSSFLPRKRRRMRAPSDTTKPDAACKPSISMVPPTAGVVEPSTSSAGQAKPRRSRLSPKDPNAAKTKPASQPFQSIVHLIKPIFGSLIDCLPISPEWRRLIINGVNYLLDTLLPFLVPLVTPILTSLLSKINNGC